MRQEIAYLLGFCGFEPVDQFSDFKGSPPRMVESNLGGARSPGLNSQ
ncbi:MAG: hypothetical protein R3D25_17850 [Geminicoccaceae bacterium]